MENQLREAQARRHRMRAAEVRPAKIATILKAAQETAGKFHI